MGLNISTDMSIITWTIARATMGRCLRAESVRWNTMKNFAAKQCMTRMVMRRRTDTDNAHLDTRFGTTSRMKWPLNLDQE